MFSIRIPVQTCSAFNVGHSTDKYSHPHSAGAGVAPILFPCHSAYFRNIWSGESKTELAELLTIVKVYYVRSSKSQPVAMSFINALANGLSRIGLNFGARNHSRDSAMSLLHDVDVPTKKATFAMACFWAPDAVFGTTQGVIRTRVGYAGGTKEGPTYRSLGDHTESIDVDFDPSATTYEKLLDIFWKNHDPTARTTKQYTSLIFYHDDEQKKLAEGTLKEQEGKHKSPIVTQILPAGTFWDAEDYHQKYRLQQHDWLMKAIGMKCGPKLKTSHVAARLNGYVIGRGGVAQFERDIARLGLSDEVADYVRKLCIKYEHAGPFC